jgi:predicted CopG family antitoxin
MAATSIAVSDETRKRLMRLKLEEGSKSMDQLLDRMVTEYRKARLLDASATFRQKLKEQGVRFEDLVA